MSGRSHSLSANSLAMAFGQLLGKGGFLAGLLVLSRYLDDTAFGALMFAVVLGQMLMLLVDAGVSIIANRQFSVDPEHRQQLMSTALGLRTVLGAGGLLLLVGASVLAGYGPLQLRYIAFIGLATVLDSFCELFYSIFRSSEKMIYEALVRAAGGLVSVALAVAVVGAHMGRQWAMMPYISRSVAMFALGALVVRGGFATRVTPVFNTSHMRTLLRESVPMAIMGFMMVAVQKLDNVIIRSLIGVEAVGAYQECFRVAETMVLLITPTLLPGALFPALCRAFKKSWSEVRSRMAEIAQLVTGLALLVAVPLWSVSDRLLPFLWGESYRRGLEFGEVLLTFRLVLLAIPFVFWMNFLVASMVAGEKQRQAAWIGFAGVLASVGLNLLLVPRMGLPGAGTALVASNLLMCVLFYLELRREGPLPLLGQLWKPLVAAVPAVSAAVLLPDSPVYLRPLASAGLFAAVWLPAGGLRYLRSGDSRVTGAC
ncbi:MAG: oligosaccharide flippase family protein [Candidatus Fermentibacteraceae bacterium]